MLVICGLQANEILQQTTIRAHDRAKALVVGVPLKRDSYESADTRKGSTVKQLDAANPTFVFSVLVQSVVARESHTLQYRCSNLLIPTEP